MRRLLPLAVLLLCAVPAMAEPTCAPRDVVLERLADTYGESRQAIGLAGPGRVVEVFASSQTGSWTITVTLPDGRTCLVASGIAYETVDEPAPARGERL